MIDGKQNESVKTYRPWVGVVLSFFIIGTSQFLAGEKFIGIGWFVIIGLLSFGSVFCLASPSIPGDMPAFILFAITFVLWIIILVKSYRPIPRFRWIGWMGFIFLFLILSVAFDPEIFVRPFRVPSGSMSPTLWEMLKDRMEQLLWEIVFLLKSMLIGLANLNGETLSFSKRMAFLRCGGKMN